MIATTMNGHAWGLEYPEWQQPVFAAILEMDRERLDELVQKAEAAVFERLLVLANEPNPVESVALAEVVTLVGVLRMKASPQRMPLVTLRYE
jgi:hypothetical protein